MGSRRGARGALLRGRGFALGIGAATLLALIVRLWFVLAVHWDDGVAGDASWYHGVANLIAEGKWFIDPATYNASGVSRPVAEHPPLFPLLLSVTSVFGGTTWRWHELATVVMGTATVPLIGLATAELANRRAGLLAAFLAALAPALWVNEGLVLSETLAATVTAGLLFVAARARRVPSAARVVVFGAVCGLSLLTRAEMLFALPLIAWAALWDRGAVATSLRRGATAAGVAALVISPWIVFNLSRFDTPVLLSNGSGITMAVSSCDQTFSGERIGYWNMECAIGRGDVPADQAEADGWYREVALGYWGDNTTKLPAVFAARVGRTWTVYRPLQMIFLDLIEGRPWRVSRTVATSTYFLYPLALAGVVISRRRGWSPWLFVAVPIAVSIAAVLTFGNTRYRVPADVVLISCAAIGLEKLLAPRRRRLLRPATTPARHEL